MRTIQFLLFFMVAVCNYTYAQISDEEARNQYAKAEQYYEAGDYNQCYETCDDLRRKLKQSNPRVLYLQIKAFYNNIESKNDKSEYTIRKSFKNFDRMSLIADNFFSLVDKSTYSPDKYKEILEIQKYINEGKKKYEYERDRKPQDAINFLNECAQKFSRRSKISSGENSGSTRLNFKLDSCFLIIDIFASLNADAARFNEVGFERIRINLSKVWIQKFSEHKYYNDYEGFFYYEFGISSSLQRLIDRHYKYSYYALPYIIDDVTSAIVSVETVSGDKSYYDDITAGYNYEFKRNTDFDQKYFDQQIAKLKMSPANFKFYFHDYFERNAEYDAGNYKQRIFEAYRFLIEYFEGGVKREKPQQINNKF